MLFSVLVPVYNAAKYLDECLASILLQSEQDFEVILADDCSQDASGELCDAYAQKYPDKIRTIHQEQNQGQLLTRRSLFQAAKGEWFVCVDADDTMEKGALAALKQTIISTGCDLILYDLKCMKLDGSIQIFDLKLEENRVYKGEDRKDVFRQRFQNCNMNSMCTKAVHRSLIDSDVDYQQWSGLRMGEDVFQSLPILDAAQAIVYLHEVLYCYRKTAGSITYKAPVSFYEQKRLLWERDDYYLLQWQLGNDTEQKAYAERINSIINHIRGCFSSVPSDKVKTHFAMYVKKISKDGFLKTQYAQVEKKRLRKRYRLYCRLMFLEQYRILYGLMAIEKHFAKKSLQAQGLLLQMNKRSEGYENCDSLHAADQK